MSISYEAHDWKKGDIITANDLKRFENGITQLINESETLGNTIKELDVADVENPAQFVSAVNQEDGKIAVTHKAFAPSITVTEGTTIDEPKFTIAVNTNESSAASLGKATTEKYGFTKLSNTIDNTETLAATPKAVKDAIDSLDVDNLSSEDVGYDATKAHITGFGADKTLTSLTETDGKINASFQDIRITSDRIINSNTNEGDVVKLNASRLIPSNLLPSYVDDVIEGYYDNGNLYSEIAHTNIIAGETGKIYVDLSTNNSYRWAENAGFTLISSTDKADKVSNATQGHFAALDSNGNLIDSGHTHSDYITDISTKADKTNTVLETYLKMGVSCVATGNRTIAIGNQASATGNTTIAIGSQVSATDDYGIALGIATAANGEESIATGSHTIASGNCSYAGGHYTRVYGVCSHVFGEYNVKDDYDNILEWSPLTNYIVGDQIKRIIGGTTYTYTCIEPNNDSTFTSDHWEQDNHTLYAEIVGNGYATPGSEEGRSNARALDWRGNEHLKGNLYVNCNADSTGGIMIGGTTVNDEKAVEFSDGTTSVTFTINELASLKTLLNS